MTRLALVLLAPFLLLGCVLTPGKFTSNLTINADRTFTYTYTGEVYGFDLEGAMKGLGDEKKPDGATLDKVAFQTGDKKGGETSAADVRNRVLADALRKEQGFRKVEYLGDNKFMIDYSVSGTLDHAFVFPFNVDAGVIVPFIAVELRANGTVRVKAPGFANESKDGAAAMADKATKTASKLDGLFTLDTSAEIVSQNAEGGAVVKDGRSVMVWKATPTMTVAPMAVLRFAGAPK